MGSKETGPQQPIAERLKDLGLNHLTIKTLVNAKDPTIAERVAVVAERREVHQHGVSNVKKEK